MMGMIFNEVEEIIVELFDEDEWDRILEECGLEGAYTSLGYYPDAEVWSIVRSVSQLLDLEVAETLRQVGRLLLPKLVARIPGVCAAFESATELLLNVNQIIHPQVKLMYPDAIPPVFEFEHDQEWILVHYRSARLFSALAEGFIMGAAEYFDELCEIEAFELPKPEGASFRVRFSPTVVG